MSGEFPCVYVEPDVFVRKEGLAQTWNVYGRGPRSPGQVHISYSYRNRNRIYYSNEMVIPNTTEVLSLTQLGSWPLYWRHASTPYVTVGACISLTGPLAPSSNLPAGGGSPPPDQPNYASHLTNYRRLRCHATMAVVGTPASSTSSGSHVSGATSNQS